MLEILQDVLNGNVFKEHFKCSLQPAHNKLCIITGPNASGKSLLRKIVHVHYQRRKLFLLHLSQAARSTGGFGRCMVYGSEDDDSTGYNSINVFLKSFDNANKAEPTGLLIDEPEIGCSEEVQLAMGLHLATRIQELPMLHGCYVITHSRLFVQSLLHLKPTHFRLGDDMTLEQWVNRPIHPANLQEVLDRGIAGYRLVHKILEEAKAKKANQ